MNEPELWVVTGIEPVTWAVPFWSQQNAVEAEIWCGMNLTQYQASVVERRIGPKTILENGHWQIAMGQLRRIGHPVSYLGVRLNSARSSVGGAAR